MRRERRLRLVGVIDRRLDRAKRVAVQLGVPCHAEADSLKGLSWLGQVDAVSIAASPQSHYPLIKDALELGKHVLTEKPFVMTVAQAQELAQLAADRKRVLAVVHNFQFASSTMRLQRDLKRGALGEIRSISAVQGSNSERRLPEWHEQLPLGLFYDESPHLLYLLRKFGGKNLRLEQVSILSQPNGARTPALLSAHFTGNTEDREIPMSLDINFATSLSEWYFMVHGSRASGIVDLFRDIYMRLPNDREHSTATVFRTSVFATAQHWMQHVTSGLRHLSGSLLYGNDVVFRRFATAICDGVEPDGIGVSDALAVTRLQHAIISSNQ